MDIQAKIAAFESYSEQVTEAIEASDDAEVDRIDGMLDELFQTILAAEAAGAEALSAQMDCLLKCLLPIEERTKLQIDICNKLLNILPLRNA